MAFILAADGRDDDVAAAFQRYREYLQSMREVFPPSAFALATSEWYFDFRDRRCPHDACLDSLSLAESSRGERGKEPRLSLNVRLLGAYHDGYIELHYAQVFGYAFRLRCGDDGHRDWRYDELRVSERGYLVHEIEWWGAGETGVWVIEASDLEFRWVPKHGNE
jgi:hypothetical protein